MKITPAILMGLLNKFALYNERAELVAPILRHQFRDKDWSFEDIQDSAKRLVQRAEAWDLTVNRIYYAVDDATRDGADRLSQMRTWPHQFTVTELLAERETIGMTEHWCRRRGSDGALARELAA